MKNCDLFKIISPKDEKERTISQTFMEKVLNKTGLLLTVQNSQENNFNAK